MRNAKKSFSRFSHLFRVSRVGLEQYYRLRRERNLAFQNLNSFFEDKIITTDPQQLLEERGSAAQ